MVEANSYQEAFYKAFRSINDQFASFNYQSKINEQAALIVISWDNSSCKCDPKKSMVEFEAFITRIYNAYIDKRPQPTLCLDESNSEDVKGWLENPRVNDLITTFGVINSMERPHGIEHNVVVIFNEKGFFQHNLPFQSTGIFISVNVPENPWRMPNCCNSSGSSKSN